MIVTKEGNGKKVVFLSGAITGRVGYKEKFTRAEKELEERGYIVLNPTVLPVGMEYYKYAPITDAMLEQADIMYLLKDWEGSEGVKHEIEKAKEKELLIIEEEKQNKFIEGYKRLLEYLSKALKNIKGYRYIKKEGKDGNN